jgi:hypothetical protein
VVPPRAERLPQSDEGVDVAVTADCDEEDVQG